MASKNFKVAPVTQKNLDYKQNSVSEIGNHFLAYWEEKKKSEERREKWEAKMEKREKKRELKKQQKCLQLNCSKSSSEDEDISSEEEEDEKNPKRSQPGTEFEVGVVNHLNLIKPGSEYRPQGHHHGFINAVLTAYNNHHALVLSPDDFWLLIGLAVSSFLGNDKEMAEKYRHTFVDHEGQKELVVDGTKHGIAPKSPKANKEGWPGFVADICAMVKAETKTDISDLLTTPFSTSGDVEKTVMQVTLMETMKNYFSYKCMMMCGIPEITLEGSPEDYQSMMDRIDKLGKILPDLEWYFVRAKEHLKKIKQSLEGKVDTNFWRSMVIHEHEGSGGQVRFTGWIADFFTDLDGSTHGQDWRRMDLDDCNAPAVTQTPFKLDDQLYTMKEYDMKLAAGFMGVAIDEKNKNAIRPAIGWMTYYIES